MRTFLTILGGWGAIILLFALSLFYEWLRRKTNKPKIGFMHFSSHMIRRGDYVCINGQVMEFNHWTSGNETIDLLQPPTEYNKTYSGCLAFNTHSVNYKFLPSSALKQCEFIYGKYGVKWAISEDWARVAKEKVNNYLRS